MNARKSLPIDPLALVRRHLPPTSAARRIVVLAVAFSSAVLVGIALLLR
jgi:hypothetical protein